ncbi:MAG: aspartate 1-decarboxylase [Acidimicrobiia bacterium]
MTAVYRTMLKSKIHRATVTRADLNYVGSVSIDPELLRAADIAEGEQVHVVNIANGNRLITYALPGDPGEICLNGAAAHKVSVGDLVIIISYAQYEAALRSYKPVVVHVDTANRQVDEATAVAAAKSRRYVEVDRAREERD